MQPSFAEALEDRRNIVLLLSDDHNYRVLGVAGNKVLRTPYLDRLAAEGVYFNRCFTPNPICMPSRACIYTGQDSWTNGVIFNGMAMFEHLDQQIGRVLDALERKKLAENTVVIFASVKGLSPGSHGIIGKQTMYEEGVRASLIVRHPGLRRAAATSSELVSTMDILPTICDAAGVAIQASVEGKSLLGIYAGTSKGREHLFFSYHDPRRFTVTRAVRTARYKLIHHLLTDERQLFDLANDPYELVNLAGMPEHEPVESKLQDALARWRKGADEK